MNRSPFQPFGGARAGQLVPLPATGPSPFGPGGIRSVPGLPLSLSAQQLYDRWLAAVQRLGPASPEAVDLHDRYVRASQAEEVALPPPPPPSTPPPPPLETQQPSRREPIPPPRTLPPITDVPRTTPPSQKIPARNLLQEIGRAILLTSPAWGAFLLFRPRRS